MGQVMQTKAHTSRMRSLVDGKVATAKSAQNPATRKPAIAHTAIRHLMAPARNWHDSTPSAGKEKQKEHQQKTFATSVVPRARINHGHRARLVARPTRNHVISLNLILAWVARSPEDDSSVVTLNLEDH